MAKTTNTVTSRIKATKAIITKATKALVSATEAFASEPSRENRSAVNKAMFALESAQKEIERLSGKQAEANARKVEARAEKTKAYEQASEELDLASIPRNKRNAVLENFGERHAKALENARKHCGANATALEVLERVKEFHAQALSNSVARVCNK